jgi:putative phosphoesterase
MGRSRMIAAIADTHLPRGKRRLPDRCLELLASAEAMIHAGDFVSLEALRELESIGPPLYAVHGNSDEIAVRRLLPAEREVTLSGHRIAVVHDPGPLRGRLERLRERYPSVAGVVFGHTHMPQHERSAGFEIFNPGSPTERRRAPHRSMGLIRLGGHALTFEHVHL